MVRAVVQFKVHPMIKGGHADTDNSLCMKSSKKEEKSAEKYPVSVFRED